MKALVIAEHADAARELCAGARTMADEVVAISFGDTVEPGVSDRIARISVPEGAVLDDAADTVVGVFDAEKPGVVLAEPTRHVKTIVGKLAYHAGTAVITDAISFEGATATSLYFGGIAQRAQKPGDVAVYTVGSGVFDPAGAQGEGAVEDVAWVAPVRGTKLVSSQPIEKSGVDLTKADVVMAAGRGFTEESQLDVARDICEKIGGGLGCTRPLTEGLDWFPREAYIGVSGLMLSPKVYVGIGTSGQMQHMVGVNRAETVFAINKDKNAPIFKQCDYGLVGDIKDVLPALAAAL
ncbi:MAG TPA: electron transfer flavoprotein subunit alpha/FixB family protein [Candidatus Aveggerthella excrementigallinarum]|nr:electron transfer flavoprotein subunit alpha/FixB family protein [Candidatus Aveggerthella excrementigallinarum]